MTEWIGEQATSSGASQSNPEPTTAEAFATVRDGVEAAEKDLGTTAKTERRAAGLACLSLLARRMGAMERALRLLVPMEHRCAQTACGLCAGRLAITDAPPVFTLDEVEKVVRNLGPLSTDYVLEHLATLRKP